MSIEALTKRVENMEDLIADIPVLLNARLETIAAGYNETGARLVVIDKQLAILTRDLRDMRGAVTRQLLAQDERLREIDARFDAHDSKFTTIDEKLASMDGKLAEIREHLTAIAGRVEAHSSKYAAMDQKLDIILDRLPPRA